jgi:hypothetical protein
MDWTLRFLPEHRVLEVVTSGELTIPDLVSMIAAASAEAVRRTTSRVLVDHRNVVMHLATMDIYDIPGHERAAGAAPDLRVAFVVPSSGGGDDFAFYENRSHNVGNIRRVFAERDPALAWLSGLAAAG